MELFMKDISRKEDFLDKKKKKISYKDFFIMVIFEPKYLGIKNIFI